MGPVDHSFHFAKDRPTVIMLCGLQGSGKTTTAGKLALTCASMAASRCWSPPTCSAPPPSSSSRSSASRSTSPSTARRRRANPVDVCRNAVAHAKNTLLDTVILDTAGRLHIDEMPMDELQQIDRARQAATRSTSSATP